MLHSKVAGESKPMGSMIYLALGRLEVDWGKNYGFTNHSALFQRGDRRDVPYYYADGIVELKEGLSKRLGDVVQRLDLLGYTENYAKQEFEALAKFNPFNLHKFSFNELANALAAVDVNGLSTDYGEGDNFGKFFRREVFERLNLGRYATNPDHAKYEAGEAMENLSPYSVLRLLARNPANLDVEVNWQYNDVLENGWADEHQFLPELEPIERFLIITEGSSDSIILRKAFEKLRPVVADYFDFVDMEEGYPFTGTGNIFRFTQGLISISVQNRMLILLDNDAEGREAFQRISALKVPQNMTLMHLPDMPEFEQVRTLGPGGETIANINGRAAAIECYLDVGPDPLVRWKNYVPDLDGYQGEIVGKREHMRRFLKEVGSNRYNTAKIEFVLDEIVRICAAMSERSQLTSLDSFSDSLD
jgi:hypothetical protein